MILLLSHTVLAEAATISLPAWAVTLISVAVSTIVTGIVGYVVKRSLDKYFKKKETKEVDLQDKLKDLEELKSDNMREQRREDMIAVVKAELIPVADKIDALIDKVSKTENGTLSSLRNDILTCYYRCCEKGYRGDWDFENIHHLFDAYKELNGNSFVRDVMTRFDELPSKEEYTKLKESEKQQKQRKIKSAGTRADHSEE